MKMVKIVWEFTFYCISWFLENCEEKEIQDTKQTSNRHEKLSQNSQKSININSIWRKSWNRWFSYALLQLCIMWLREWSREERKRWILHHFDIEFLIPKLVHAIFVDGSFKSEREEKNLFTRGINGSASLRVLR